MRVMLVHNFYGSSAPSGENVVVEAERALLQSKGHEVSVFARCSDEIRGQGVVGMLRGAIATPWNPQTARQVGKLVKEVSPEIVHVHNTFPLISPSIFRAVGDRAATVLTLHNYRLFCPAAIPMRNGRTCTNCIEEKAVFSALRYGCYRGSRAATLPLAFSVGLHRHLKTWERHVDRFVALSEFQRCLMGDAGLGRHNVDVKPNFYPGNPRVVPWDERKPYVAFAGRLTSEKGVRTLLRAWRLWGVGAPELRIAGDGGLRGELEQLARGLPVRFLGQVTSAEAQAHIAGARLLVLPSEWFEGFPMVVREAFAFGTPVAASDLGPLPSIVQNGKSGVVFPAADSDGLLDAVRSIWERADELRHMGEEARLEFETKYNENANYKLLMEIYERATAMANLRRSH